MSKSAENISRRFSVAPMMDWTDRHCRFLHRVISKDVLLYTEMITAAALVHGDAARLLRFDDREHPVALQIGGSDPELLAQAARLGQEAGYDEINLNCGCPSDRVQSGWFGACLMAEPDLVARSVAAMRSAVKIDVTVKCRIGIDDQDPYEVLPAFIKTIAEAGVTSFAIHARKAWLEGLSPKENRDIPPLDYALVHQIKAEFPELEIVINGGIESFGAAVAEIEKGLDGAMIGRAAYHQPMDILGPIDTYAQPYHNAKSPQDVVEGMQGYVKDHLASGGQLHQITRHMLGLFAGKPGARGWRRHLSENAHKSGSDWQVVLDALDRVQQQQESVLEHG